jgi:hypothetical protein
VCTYGFPACLRDNNSADASPDLRKSLSEEYLHSVNFSDGEIFLKLRQYADKPNKEAGTLFVEKRMWGRLSPDKRKDLRQILNNELILADLDSLRILPALFCGFRIAHSLMAMKCPEVSPEVPSHIFELTGF